MTPRAIVLPTLLLLAACAPLPVEEIPELGITAPVTVQDVQMFLDGGTVAFTFVDRHGETLDCCLDGRMAPPGESDGSQPKHLFIGTKHPSYDGAEELPIGGPKEQAIARLLADLLDGRRGSVNAVDQVMLESIVDVLSRKARRRATQP